MALKFKYVSVKAAELGHKNLKVVNVVCEINGLWSGSPSRWKKASQKLRDIVMANGAIPFYCDSSQHCYANQ